MRSQRTKAFSVDPANGGVRIGPGVPNRALSNCGERREVWVAGEEPWPERPFYDVPLVVEHEATPKPWGCCVLPGVWRGLEVGPSALACTWLPSGVGQSRSPPLSTTYLGSRRGWSSSRSMRGNATSRMLDVTELAASSISGRGFELPPIVVSYHEITYTPAPPSTSWCHHDYGTPVRPCRPVRRSHLLDYLGIDHREVDSEGDVVFRVPPVLCNPRPAV